MAFAVDHKTALIIGAKVAAVRIGVLWFLTLLRVTGKEGLWELPLILLLLPEGLVVPEGWSPMAFGIALSSLLLAGSLLVALLLSYTIRGASVAMRLAVTHITRR